MTSGSGLRPSCRRSMATRSWVRGRAYGFNGEAQTMRAGSTPICSPCWSCPTSRVATTSPSGPRARCSVVDPRARAFGRAGRFFARKFLDTWKQVDLGIDEDLVACDQTFVLTASGRVLDTITPWLRRVAGASPTSLRDRNPTLRPPPRRRRLCSCRAIDRGVTLMLLCSSTATSPSGAGSQLRPSARLG